MLIMILWFIEIKFIEILPISVSKRFQNLNRSILSRTNKKKVIYMYVRMIYTTSKLRNVIVRSV